MDSWGRGKDKLNAGSRWVWQKRSTQEQRQQGIVGDRVLNIRCKGNPIARRLPDHGSPPPPQSLRRNPHSSVSLIH